MTGGDMDATARAAMVMAQVASLNAEVAAMQAANEERARKGLAQAYCEEAFQSVRQSYTLLDSDRCRVFLDV